MMGPDIFTNPFVGGFSLLMVAIIMILFIVKLMPYIFTKSNTFKILELLKLLIIFVPLAFALGSLFDYVAFDLVGWINFAIIALSGLYFIELILKQMKKVMHK